MEYRRVESHDGAVIRVQEYRRHAVSPVGSIQASTGRLFATAIEGSSMKSTNRSRTLSMRPRQAVVEADQSARRSESEAGHHVTVVSPRPNRSQAKPVIIQESRDSPNNVTKSQLKNTAYAQHDLLSPPPTPRLGRLRTPDIPDLDNNPFCGCCEGSNHFKYCTFCSVEIERSLL